MERRVAWVRQGDKLACCVAVGLQFTCFARPVAREEILIVHGTFTAAERPRKKIAMYFYGPAADA